MRLHVPNLTLSKKDIESMIKEFVKETGINSKLQTKLHLGFTSNYKGQLLLFIYVLINITKIAD